MTYHAPQRVQRKMLAFSCQTTLLQIFVADDADLPPLQVRLPVNSR